MDCFRVMYVGWCSVCNFVVILAVAVKGFVLISVV